MIGRIAVLDVGPSVSCGRWPAKVVPGETFPVTATVFRDGHDLVGATAVLAPARGRAGAAVRVPMRLVEPGLDRWAADVSLPHEGRWTLQVEGWADPVASWRHGVETKLAAGQQVDLELAEGALLFERAAAERLRGAPRGRAATLRSVAKLLRDEAADPAERVLGASSRDVLELLIQAPLRDLVTGSERLPVLVERERALVGSWYELFPRSEGGLRAAEGRLDAIAGMGFDVVYLPPVHPIGRAFRKGPNNSVEAGPDDPGSPWAIGGPEGGHDTVDPGLGTTADLAHFAAAAAERDMEVALDLALQCSPDHPWVRAHPDWFVHRADGSIAYAENPPKRYQDIYPVAFDADPEGLLEEVARLVRHWRGLGIRMFRVDNPHTKPLVFWERLIALVQEEDPGLVFLAEAFTRPAMMHALARIGFTQSYTYFTWRNRRDELEAYLTDLTSSPTADYMRPNLWVNTPDILHAYLQYGGPAAFRIRAVLAATLSPSWGLYSGYELYEHEAVRAGSEEYLDSEKYQLRHRDWSRAEERLAPYLRRLNELRRGHVALRRLRGLRFHNADNPEILSYSRSVDGDTVLTVVNLDPHSPQEATLHLDLPALGLGWSDSLVAEDQLGARESYRWGPHNYVRLDPFTEPAHLLVVRPGVSERGGGPRVSELLGGDPQWFRRAVFYEVLVRGFHDSNGDGTGDLRGLAGKLDYMQWLGVDCLWLLPIYASPLRDGGYDISDFFSVLPEFGNLGDFVQLVTQAHTRGIRVVADLVMNHTSDQHPWFQASRSDRDGPYGDFYVWSDTEDLYKEARVIFVDTEKSNWTFDPVRNQYYWHRFFSHQPDLNYANPRVQDAMIEVLKFWLDLGIDGFRLDAVPYLFERDGTNCENLPETHDYLRRIRREIDALYPDTVLLAEANQWPSDVVEYFGDPAVGGDECHMAFHFPLMPRIFMAVRRESRYPISEILAQTPPIPTGCQWGIFLRNHDELTLEMVTDEERDYMYREYATDPRMKANVGIRRRLAPLLENSRAQVELFTSLLMSLPGSPVMYYGDEIGMGDNIYLGDRDGVRTPMQWTSDRNAGFSLADPQRLYLPLLLDPVYGYQALNVDAEMRNSHSLLHWTRRLIAVRKQHPVFGLGSFEELGSSNPCVIAYLRQFGDDRVLCVANLSRFAQPVELDLRRFEGLTPVELMGSVHFPRIGELPYLLTLPGHGYFWFALTRQEALAP